MIRNALAFARDHARSENWSALGRALGPEAPSPRRPLALFPPHFSVVLHSRDGEGSMRKTLAIAVVGLALMPGVAAAGERPADAALGALAGAVVLGPVGLVAGAVVGYTAGPSISHGMRRGETR